MIYEFHVHEKIIQSSVMKTGKKNFFFSIPTTICDIQPTAYHAGLSLEGNAASDL